MDELKAYFDNTQKPWGKLFYKTIWAQLSFAKGMNILDFGSGFGITADYMAKSNAVTAIEPNRQMCDERIHEHKYLQMTGDISSLDKLPQSSFDLIICHNVLEYVDDKEACIRVFSSLLKNGGKLSLVKHNHIGRIMGNAVGNHLELAMQQMNGQAVCAQNFGEIKYYDLRDIVRWSDMYGYKHFDVCGVRIFFGLISDNDLKYSEDWQESMLELELKVCRIEEFRNIAFYHHVILERTAKC